MGCYLCYCIVFIIVVELVVVVDVFEIVLFEDVFFAVVIAINYIIVCSVFSIYIGTYVIFKCSEDIQLIVRKNLFWSKYLQ